MRPGACLCGGPEIKASCRNHQQTTQGACPNRPLPWRRGDYPLPTPETARRGSYSPAKKRSRTLGGRGIFDSWFALPAPQDGVGQDARTEQQRGRGQQDGRTTAGRELAVRGFFHHHGGLFHHGCVVLRQGHRRKDQHNQESGRSQKYRSLHSVLLLYSIFQTVYKTFSSREGYPQCTEPKRKSLHYLNNF
jgi:hypothetical protein